MREICRKLIDRFAGKGGCDAAVDYAQEIPARVIAHMLGLPDDEGDRFRRWIHEILEARHHRAGRADEGDRRDHEVFPRRDREAPRRADRRSDQLSDEREDRRRAARRGSSARHAAPAADRRHRHHLERDRRVLLASGAASRGPAPARRRAGADPDRGRGVPARLRAGHDGARGDQGHDHQRLPVQAGRDGAALVPGGEPRSGGVRGRRTRGDRPRGEPPRGVRARHPPLHRLEPRPHGDHGRAAGMVRPHPRIPARPGARR